MLKKIIPLSGGIDSGYLLAKAIDEGHQFWPVEFDDGEMDHAESRAARRLAAHYGVTLTSLRIPKLDLLKVRYPVETAATAQAAAMKEIDYWSGFKALFYATTLAFGGAIGADEIEFGVNEWNEHFVDELPASASIFRTAWAQLYPDLRVPQITFPLIGIEKSEVVSAAAALGFPFELSYSCFKDAGPCKACLGCQHRQSAFEEAGIDDRGSV